MCIFQNFTFLCGAEKLKIFKACTNTSINAQGQVFCRNDPHPHVDDDEIFREYEYPGTYGPGVCSNIHCRWKFGLLPVGMFEEDVVAKYGKGSVLPFAEDDTPFNLSEDARKEREEQWFRKMLTTDQQLECLHMPFPLNQSDMSLYAQAWFSQIPLVDNPVTFNRVEELSAEQLHWSELNPRYMDGSQLHHATGFLLPASVTVPGHVPVSASTPHMPWAGPFKVGPHECKPLPGICHRCGQNAGDPSFAEKQQQHDLLPGHKNWPPMHHRERHFV